MQKNAATHPFNLDEIRVAAPCTADWDAMKGDDRTRFCGQCRKNVYNLSDMSRKEAEALILQTKGRVCAQFYRRPDGTILTDNCPVGLRVLRNRMRWMAVAASAALMAIGAFAGMRSAKAAGVSVREVQPFKTMQNVQPVKALVDWLDPVMVAPPVPMAMIKGDVCAPMPPKLIPPTPPTSSTAPAK